MSLPPLTLSDKYGIFAVLALALVILIDRPVVTMIVCALGLAIGVFVALRGETQRVAWVAAAGFAVAFAFGLIGLLR